MADVQGLTVERRADPLGIDARQPRFAWQLSEGTQSAYQLEVSTSDGTPVWDSGRQDSVESVYVAYGGPPLASRTTYRWRVRAWAPDGLETEWSAPGTFEMGLLEPTDWTAAWITHLVLNTESAPEDFRLFGATPLLRRRFQLGAAPRRARLYITALGLYEATLNGARVGDERLTPGWTDYHTRIQYQAYDVTQQLVPGQNVLGVRLGDGWYAGSVGGWGRRRYGDRPELLCQLDVELDTGEHVRIVSDEQWRTADGGTWLNDIQLGERTDFRDEPTGWLTPFFVDTAWSHAARCADPGARLVASREEGIRVVDDAAVASVRGVGDGRYIVDTGVNGAGVMRLHVSGTPNQHVIVRHAEALDAGGQLYIENLRGAEQQDEFILAGEGRVALEPRFTFHGFRYAEVSGLDGQLAEADFQSELLSSATRLIGSFTCSDERVERLQKNIMTSLRANFISIPTDCPQRNERLGWTADLQIFAPTALFNADLTNMIDKWLDDLRDAQLPSGAYPDIAPAPSGWAGAGDTAWSDAGVIVPWVLYERSGDAGVLERMYGSIKRYMAYLEADQTDGLRFAGRYGDWVSLGAPTDKLLIGTAYLAYASDLFSRIAGVLGRSDDQDHYANFYDRVRTAFRDRFITSSGELTSQTQTAYAMAIGFNLLEEAERPAAGNRLAELVEQAGTHLATGFLGTPIVMPALSDTGHHELACRLLRQDSYPSWLFEVVNGATSIWERWNGWTPQDGFYSPRMNSFNHYAFGAVGDWMYRYLAGLEPIEPGYRRTRIQPRPGGGFTSARAAHESLYGTHVAGWRLQDGQLEVEAVIPANTSATVLLPDGASTELGPGAHTVRAAYTPR